MTLEEFTSFDDIRAALGVSSDEIEDPTLSLPLYEFNLIAELESVDLALIADFTLYGVDTDQALLTDIQARFVRSARMFAAYVVAKQLTVSLPLFSPKEMTDGKAGFVRYAQDPYRETIDRVGQEFDKWRIRLSDAYRAVKSVAAGTPAFRSLMVVASPISDPITGT